MNTATESIRVNDEIAQLILSPRAYAEQTALFQGLRWLRAHNPVGRVEVEGYDPFWATTKHADIVEISRQNDLFHNGDEGTILRPRATEDLVRSIQNGSPHLLRSMITMDAPEHPKYRRAIQAWFMPQKLQSIETRIRRLAREAVDHMATFGGECDFCRDIAFHYPLRVVMEILGIPAEDESLMLRFTKELLGRDDEDLRRDARSEGTPEDRLNQRLDVIADLENYFARITEARRTEPRDDLATVIANVEIDGAPVGRSVVMNYFILMINAGHETTSSSISGAIWALCECPDEFHKVKADRSLVPNLVEEAVRYTSPVGHFMRSATAETSLSGRTIAKGDRLMLCYPSGNRDEEVFDEPDQFRVDRDSTLHRTFGNGAHVCLGQHLARLEIRIFFEELLPRLEHVELAGPPRRSASTLVSGPKTVPIRFRMD
jgi:cytochrome P450